MLAVDVWTSLVSATGFCYKSEPDSVPETLGAVLRVISQNGASAEIPASAVWGSNRMYHEAPFTLMGDLSAIADKVDLKQVTAIEIEVPAGKAPRHIALDEVRLLK